MASKFGSKQNAKKAKTSSKIAGYDNVILQVKSAVESLDKFISATAIGKPTYVIKMSIVKTNVKVFAGTIIAMLDAMKPVLGRTADIKLLSRVVDSFSNINPDGFVKFLKGITGVMSDKKLQRNAKDMTAIAVGIAEIIGAIKDIGNSDIGKNIQIISDIMDKAPDAMKTIAKETKHIYKYINKTDKNLKSIIKHNGELDKSWKVIDKTLSKILKTMSKSMDVQKKKDAYTIGDMADDLRKFIIQTTLLAVAIVPASLIIIPAMVVLKAIVASLIWACDNIGKLGRKSTLKKLDAANRAILSISATFALFVLTIYTIGQAASSPDLYKGILALTLLVTISLGVLYVLASKPVQNTTREGRLSILAIAATFTLFTLSLFVIGQAAVDTGMTEGVVAFIGLVGISLGALWVLSHFSNDVTKGAMAMLVMSGAMIGFTLTTKLILDLNITKKSWKSFGYFSAIVGLGVAALVGASVFVSSVVKGAAALALVSIALLLFTLPVMAINSLNIDKHSWRRFGFFASIVGSAVGVAAAAGLPGVFLFALRGAGVLMAVAAGLSVFSAAMVTISDISKKSSPKEIKSMMTCMRDVMITMRDSVKKISIKDIYKINKLYGGMSKAMKSMAEAYEIMGRIDADPQALADAVSTMMKGAVDAFVKTAADPSVKSALDEMNDWGVKGLINGIIGKKSAISKLLALSSKIGNATAGMASGIRDMADMRVKEYDKNGKVIGYRQLTNKDFQAAATGITTIVGSLFRALGEDTKDPVIKSLLKGKLEKTQAWKSISSAKLVGEAIGELAKGLVEMSDMTYTDESGKKVKVDATKSSENVSKLISNMFTGFASVKIDKKLPGYIKDTSTALDNLVSTTNNLDLSKAEKMTSLLGKIADIGKGINWNFKELANVIEGKLIETLENLKEVLEQTNENILSPQQNEQYTPNSINSFAYNNPSKGITIDGNPPAPDNGPMKESKPDNNIDISGLTAKIDDITNSLKDIIDSSRAGGFGVSIKNFEDFR